jgi:hypothetical protein
VRYKPGSLRIDGLEASLVLGLLLGGCGQPAVERSTAAIVYGSDERTDYYASDSAAQALIAGSVVALVAGSELEDMQASSLAEAQTYQQKLGLCPDEAFADQPAPAFCSGVLADWDLVLTAGHCLRRFALEDFVVVFDFYYSTADRLALSSDSIRRPVEIVNERLDAAGSEPRLDYGWLKLDRAVDEKRAPVPLYREPAPLQQGDSILAIGSSGGLPLKADAGGRVTETRPEGLDWFTATTDTSHGASGAGAFDRDAILTGILARGGTDFVTTDEGCLATALLSEDAAAEEQYTYVHRALEGLCERTESSLCRADCGEPCTALPPPPVLEARGCSLSLRSDRQANLAWSLSLALLLVSGRRLRPIVPTPPRAQHRQAR